MCGLTERMLIKHGNIVSILPLSMNKDLMLHFDEQVASDLEFDVIRAMLAEKALQPTSKSRAHALVPLKNRKTIVRLLQETDELRRIKTEGEIFPSLEFEEMPDEIRMLEIRDSVLTEASFTKISRASNTVNQIVVSLKGKENKYPRLHDVQKDVYYTQDLITPIAKVFNAKGEISDKASHVLKNIREEMIISALHRIGQALQSPTPEIWAVIRFPKCARLYRLRVYKLLPQMR